MIVNVKQAKFCSLKVNLKMEEVERCKYLDVVVNADLENKGKMKHKLRDELKLQ